MMAMRHFARAERRSFPILVMPGLPGIHALFFQVRPLGAVLVYCQQWKTSKVGVEIKTSTLVRLQHAMACSTGLQLLRLVLLDIRRMRLVSILGMCP